jgi:hypothetical protein
MDPLVLELDQTVACHRLERFHLRREVAVEVHHDARDPAIVSQRIRDEPHLRDEVIHVPGSARMVAGGDLVAGAVEARRLAERHVFV